jgi:hypothetical protein
MRTLIVILVCVVASQARAGMVCMPMGNGLLSCKGPGGPTPARIDFMDGEFATATIVQQDKAGKRSHIRLECMRIDDWLDCR